MRRRSDQVYKTHFILAGFLCLLITLVSSSAWAGWFNPSWSYRKQITIDPSMTPNTDRSWFPALIYELTDAQLAASACTNGEDILFTKSDGTTQLDHEIEDFNSGTGELTAWVEIENLSSSVDTNIYMYYGNGACVNQENVSGTWDEGGSNNYHAVYHLNEDPSISTDGDCGGIGKEACDSTSKSNDLDAVGSMQSSDLVPGKIGGAVDFDDADTMDYLMLPDASLSAGFPGKSVGGYSGSFTLSAWVNVHSLPTSNLREYELINKYASTSGQRSFRLSLEGSSGQPLEVDRPFFGPSATGGLGTYAHSTTKVTVGSWYYVVGVYDGTDLRMYFNANMEANAKNPRTYSSGINLGTDDFVIGARTNAPARWADAIIDEARVASTNRSADWIQTEYNNQSNPAGYLTFAAEKISISGTCKKSDESTDCTDAGADTIRVAVNGSLQGETQTTVAGTWTISGVSRPSTGDVITVYIEGAANLNEAVAVTKYDGTGNISDVQLIEQHLTIGSNDNQTLSNADLGQYDNSVSTKEDIFHDVAAGNLTVDVTTDLTDEELHIITGNGYTPGGNVSTKDVEILGTVTAGSNTFTVSGDWDSSLGTFTRETSTVDFAGTGTVKGPGTSLFYNAGFAAAGQITTFTSNIGITNNTTLGTGEITGVSSQLNISKSTGQALYTAGATISLPVAYYAGGGGTMGVTGTTYGSTLRIHANAATKTYELLGDVTCRDLIISGNGDSRESVLDTQGFALNTSNGGITIGKSGFPAQNGKLIANNSTIDVNGNVIIYDGGGNNLINAGSSSWTVSGNWTNSDTFTAGSSTVTFDAGATGNTITSGGSSFYDVDFNNAGGAWTFQDTFSAANDFTVTDTDTTGNGVDTNNQAVNVTRDFTLSAGYFTAGTSTITVGRNWDSSGMENSWSLFDSSVILTGTGTVKQRTSGGGWNYLFGYISLAAAGQTSTLTSSNLWTWHQLTVGSGTFTDGANSYTVYLQGVGDVFVDGGATITVQNFYYRSNAIRGSQNVVGRDYTGISKLGFYAVGSGGSDNINNMQGNIIANTIQIWENNSAGNRNILNTNNHDITANNLYVGLNGDINDYGLINAGSSTIDVNGNVIIYASDGSGDNEINAGSSSWTVSGNWTNNDTFTAGTSTVTFDGTASRTLDSGGSAFNNLEIDKTSATDANDNLTVLTNDLTVNGTLTITDGELIQQRSITSGSVTLSDASSKWTNTTDNANVTLSSTVDNTGTITFDAPTGDLIQIRSSVGGTQRNWQGAGTFSMTDVDVQDQTCLGGTPANITVSSGTDTGNNINWIFGSSTIGGTVYTDDDEATTLNNKAVTVVVYNGATQASYTTTTNGSGVYSITNGTLAAGDIIAVYLDDETEEGTTVFKSDGNNVADLNVYQNHVSIRSDSGAFSNVEIANADDDDDDVKYNVAGNDITLDSDYELYIFSGSTYTPGGNVDTQGATGDVDIRGTVNAGSNTFTITGDWDSTGGTFNSGTSTLVMTGAGNSLRANNNTLKHLTINAGATITAQSTFYILANSDLTISGTFNIAAGQQVSIMNPNSITVNTGGELGGGGTFLQRVGSGASVHTFDGTISVATYKYNILNNADTPPGHILTGATYGGDLEIVSSGNTALNYVYISGGDLTVGGTLTVATDLGWFGPITTILYNAQENRNITAGGLVVGNAGATDEYGQFIAGSGNIDINGDVIIYASDGSGTNQIDAGSSTWNVSGNWTNNDTFTAGTSTVTFDGTVSRILDSGGSSFNNLEINKTDVADANDNLTVQTNDLTVNGTFTITDGELIQQRSITSGAVTLSDNSSKWTNTTDNANVTLSGTVSSTGTITFDAPTGDLIQIRSSVGGTQRNWQGAGTFSMSDVDVQDQTCLGGTPADITVTSGTDTGNNINWIFGSSTIGGTVYTDDDEATTLNNKAVTVVVYNGATQSSYTTTTDGSGLYSITNGVLAAGDIIAVYVNDEAEEGTTVFRSDGNNVADLNVYQNHVSIRSDSGAISNAEIANADDGDDDMKYVVSGSDITLDSGYELYVFTGSTYTPGGNLNTQGATGDVDIRGTVNGGSNTFTITGDWDSSSGTMTYNSSTLIMTGAGKNFQTQPAQRPWNLTIGDGVTPASVSHSSPNWVNVVDNDLVLSDNATLNVSGTYYYMPKTGGITLGTGATLDITGVMTRNIDDSSSHISTAGTISGTGIFQYHIVAGNTNAPITARTYDVHLALSGGENDVAVLGGGASLDLGGKNLLLYDANTNNGSYGTLDNSGNIPVTAAELQVATSQGTGNWPTKTGKLICRGATYTFTNVVVYSSNTAAPTIDCLTGGESSAWIISGNVSIDGSRTYNGLISAGSSTWTIGGDWTNSGTFTAGTSTVNMNGADQAISGSSTFNDLTKVDSLNDATDVTLTFDNTATQTISGILTLDGFDDDDRINLVSDSPGDYWEIVLGATATKVIDFVDVQDSDASGSDASHKPVDPADSINSGHNVDWFYGLTIVKQVWEEGGTAPLGNPTAPVGATLVFLIYVKNTNASTVSDLRINDDLDEAGFEYQAGTLRRTNDTVPPADTDTDLVIFNKAGDGTSIALTDAVDAAPATEVASAQDTVGPVTVDKITIGAVAAQTNAGLSIGANETFALRFKVKVK